jgi:hypothetical protein
MITFFRCSAGITQIQFSELIVKLDDLKVSTDDLKVSTDDLKESARKQRRASKIVVKEVVISHRARMDIWSSSKRTRQEQNDFKNKLISYYQRAHPTDLQLVKCMLLDDFFPRHGQSVSHLEVLHPG